MGKSNSTIDRASILVNLKAGTVDKSYCLEVTWWADSTPTENMQTWLRGGLRGIRAYWTAYHDEPEEKPHYHTVFWSKNEKTWQEWSTWLTRTGCPAVRSVNEKATDHVTLSNNVTGSLRYLFHMDTPTKWQGYTVEKNLMQEMTQDPENKLHEWTTSTTLAEANRRRKNPEDNIDTISMVAMCRYVHDNGITTMTELVMMLAEDAPMMRFVRENKSLVMEFIKDEKNSAGSWTVDSRGALKEQVIHTQTLLRAERQITAQKQKTIEELQTEVVFLRAKSQKWDSKQGKLDVYYPMSV